MKMGTTCLRVSEAEGRAGWNSMDISLVNKDLLFVWSPLREEIAILRGTWNEFSYNGRKSTQI